MNGMVGVLGWHMLLMISLLSIHQAVAVVDAVVINIGVVLPTSPPGAIATQSTVLKATIQLAIDEINTLNILSNNTIQMVFQDSKADLGQAFFAAEALALNNSVAVIGDLSSSLSINEQYALRYYKVPQISAASTEDSLSDKTTFPYFLRTCSHDSVSTLAVLSFVKSMGWTSVTAFTVENTDVASSLQSNTLGITVTVYTIRTDLSNLHSQIAQLNTTDIAVVLVLADYSFTDAIIAEANNQGLVGAPRVWIGGDGLVDIRTRSYPTSVMSGMIAVSMSPGQGANYTAFVSKLSVDSFLAANLPPYLYQSKHYDTTFAIAYALSAMINAGQDIHDGALLLSQLKQTSFQGANGLISFDANGDLASPIYDVLNWQGAIDPVTVGSWTASDGIQLSASIMWPDGTSNTPNNDISGKVLNVGILLPITGDLHVLATSWQSAIKYAVDTINANNFIPGYTITTSVGDTQGDSGLAILQAFDLVNDGVLGVIGSGYSSDSETAQLVFRNFKIPQISGSATSDDLSNKTSYPTFFRTVPVDSEQGSALAHIVSYYGWTRISVMITDDSYSSNCYSVFSGIVSQLGVTTVTVQIMHTGSTDASAYVSKLKDSGSVIFVLIALPGDATVLLEEARKQGLLQSNYVWVTSDGIATLSESSLVDGGYDELVSAMDGVIATIAAQGHGGVYDKFVSDASQLDSAVYPGLNPPATYTTFYYDCIYTYAYAFKSMREQGLNLKDTTKFIDAISKVNFTGVTGLVQFNADNDRTNVNFAIVNWRAPGEFVQVATWESSTGFNFSDKVVWPDGSTVIPKDVPDKHFETNAKASKIILILFASIASAAVFVAAGILIYFYKSSVTNATNISFSLAVFIGGVLGYMDIVVNSISPPDDNICRARVWVPCIAFALLYGALLSKFVHSFRIKKRSHINNLSVLMVVGPVLLIELIILIIWTSIESERPKPYEKHNGSSYVMWCTNSTVFVTISMVYKGLLLFFGAFLVIQIGEYPSFYSESYYLRVANWTLTLTTCFGVALVYILDGQVVSMTAVYSVIVLIGLSITLGFILIPKCRLLIRNKEGCRDSTVL